MYTIFPYKYSIVCSNVEFIDSSTPGSPEAILVKII